MVGVGGGSGPWSLPGPTKCGLETRKTEMNAALGFWGSLPGSLSDCALHSQAAFAPDTCGALLTSIPWERYKMLVLNQMKFCIAEMHTNLFNDLVLLLVGKCIIEKIL